MIRLSDGRRWTGALAALALVLVGACSAPDDSDAKAPDAVAPSTIGPTDGGSEAPVPPVPSVAATSLPTVGLPTEARFRLLRAGGKTDDPVVRAYTRFWEQSTEGIRAYETADSFARLVSPGVLKQFADKSGRDRRVGRTVSLRPVGRLESLRALGSRARITACVWSPSVSYYYVVDGSPAEKIEQQWLEVVTDLEKTGDAWIVTRHARTGQSCRGGKP